MTEETRAREVLIQNGMHESINQAIGLAPYNIVMRAMLAFADEARLAERERLLSELWEPSEELWGNLPRHMIMWLDMTDRPTPGSLRKHLGRVGCEIPGWLDDEPEMQWADHVISKGTRAVMIYRAMLPATAIRKPHP